MRWNESPAGAPRSALAQELELQSFAVEDGQVIEGVLRDAAGHWYPITRGVPCFLQGALRPDFSAFCRKYGLGETQSVEQPSPEHTEQQRTNVTFSDKWSRFQSYGIDEGHREFLFEWYCRKLGLQDIGALRGFYRDKHTILEVGPGSGFNARFMAEHSAGQVYALDISEAAYTTFGNTRDLSNCHVVQADLMEAPFKEASFDFVIADGVLHHTPDTREAMRALYRLVQPGGQFFFYVYRKMGAARQFCDQYIRSHFTQLEPEDCYRACEGLTELGRELSRLNATIHLEKGVPVLGIPPGEHDVQRLLYYNFVKCFWNDAFDAETNNMVNFDWYHPLSAWQHTEEEVRGWMEELGVSNYAFHPANPNGISVLLERPG
jgi:SAM-dependent methyltransferase